MMAMVLTISATLIATASAVYFFLNRSVRQKDEKIAAMYRDMNRISSRRKS